MKITFITVCFVLFVGKAFAQLDFSKANQKEHPLFNKLNSKILAGDYEEITSVLIAKDGKLIYEKYYNGASVHSKHNTRSATKTMATLLTGVAIKDQKITSEKDKIFDHLKWNQPIENPDVRKEAITIEDLLTMSSIVECDDNDDFSRGNENRMYIVEDWSKFYINLPVRAYPYTPKPADAPYGRNMSYCSAGSALVTEVVQAAIEMPAKLYLKERLLKPLGIENYKLHFSPTGTLNTAGGSEYQSRDLLKIIQLCLQKGAWNKQQIMPSSWINKATTPKTNAWEGMDYGYLFWLKKFGKTTTVASYAMAGNGGNKVVAFPDLNVTIVLTSTNYNNRKAHGYTDEILNEYVVPALLSL